MGHIETPRPSSRVVSLDISRSLLRNAVYDALAELVREELKSRGWLQSEIVKAVSSIALEAVGIDRVIATTSLPEEITKVLSTKVLGASWTQSNMEDT